jgi:O-antigen ligase
VFVSALFIVFSSLVVMVLLGLTDPVRGWWAGLWSRRWSAFVLILAMAVTFIGGSGQAAADEGLAAASGARLVRAIAMVTLFGIAMAGILRNTHALRRAGPAALWMVAYALLAITSLTYSISPFISAWKGFEVLVLVVTVISLAGKLRTLDDIQSTLNILWLMLLFLILTALFGTLFVPERAFAKLELSSSIVISGVYPEINANSLTQFSALLAVVIVALVLKPGRRAWGLGHIMVMILSTTTMLMAHSRTSILAGLVALLTVIYYAGRRALFIGSLIAAVLAWTSAEFVADYILRGQSQEVFLSMSGRTHFWEGAWPYFLQSPMLGHGFYSAQRVIIGTSSVDNTYLEVVLGLGILGLAIFSVPIGLTAYYLFRTRPVQKTHPTEQGLWLELVTLFILLAVRSLTGPSFQVMHPNLVMFVLLVVCLNGLVRLTNSVSSRVPPARANSAQLSLPSTSNKSPHKPRFSSATPTPQLLKGRGSKRK